MLLIHVQTDWTNSSYTHTNEFNNLNKSMYKSPSDVKETLIYIATIANLTYA
jgi:hypothetical protein